MEKEKGVDPDLSFSLIVSLFDCFIVSGQRSLFQLDNHLLNGWTRCFVCRAKRGEGREEKGEREETRMIQASIKLPRRGPNGIETALLVSPPGGPNEKRERKRERKSVSVCWRAVRWCGERIKEAEKGDTNHRLRLIVIDELWTSRLAILLVLFW